MIRERILAFLQNYLSPDPPDLEQGPQPDPALVDILDEGVDEDFRNGRTEAIEKLETLDVAAFWLQAVGDGSPVETAANDTLETNTPHRMAWEAGFDDTLDYQEVSQIAHQLFAHHIGTIVTPAHESVSDRAALDNILDPAVEYAIDLHGEPTAANVDIDARADGADWEDVEYPRPRSLDHALKGGRSLLESESMTYFWIQVLCDVGDSSFVMQVGGPSPETPNMFVDHPIEYVVGIPRTLGATGEMNLTMQSLAQHLSYGARVTDESVGGFASNALDMALEMEYLHDSPKPM